MKMDFDLSLPVAIAAILIAVAVYSLLQVGKRDPRMPKGPPTVPLLGNLHQIPPSGIHRKFRDWADEYGPVFSLKIGPANAIVLCDREAIHKLLDKKGNIYSSRPNLYLRELLQLDDRVALHVMDGVWRDRRKVMSHNFSPSRLDKSHYRVQEAEGVILLNDLLKTPEEFFHHVRRYTASVASVLVYGQRAVNHKSFWAQAVYEVMELRSELMEPGAVPPVDQLPILKYVPAFLAQWKRNAIKSREVTDEVWSKARQIVEERRATGEMRDSIADNFLDEYSKAEFPMTQRSFDNMMGEIIEGGADTTASQLLTLILAFATHPEVQIKARTELDALCGIERMPDWSDFESLPYINAIVKEGMRWRPVSVAALPHMVTEDDYYKGMLIPKNSTIYIPTWALHHQEKLFKDHDVFNPDRYLGFNKLANDYAGNSDWIGSPHHYGYGAGRRICPGIHLAERSMWRTAAKLLWAYDFSEQIDPKTKNVIPLDTSAYAVGVLTSPLPFKVTIKPRSPIHMAKIESELPGALNFMDAFN